MKKIISLLLCLSILATCFSGLAEETTTVADSINWNQDVHFTGMSDENLLSYVEGTVYSQLVADLDSDEYFVESVTAVYISQEYLAELAYNSKVNVFFGYSLSDLDAYFEGSRYVFTVNGEGQTVVEELKTVTDDTYNQILTNIAVGTGVILVCVTITVLTSGAGAPAAVNLIFAAAAKTATTCALSGSVISGVSAAVVKGYQTGDLNEALKAGALGASEGYKWGAITGAITGGSREAFGLYKVSSASKGLSMNDVARIQKETSYPVDVIKQFHSLEEYKVFRDAHLQTQMVNNKLALVRTDINLSITDKYGRTNLERMANGLAPLDSTGKAFELHHIGQEAKGTLAILTSTEHDNAALHGFKSISEIDRPEFKSIREAFWKSMAKILGGV